MKINVLTADVYNRIAAGEVIDRPYSVVKELVENAVDSGAKEISVEIERGGKSLIRVTDNGCGIERDELPHAYLPHATSKICSAEDLFRVTTLGFRGEAVASIASVSRMNIASNSGEEGYSLASEGGVMGEILPSSAAKGTQVTVSDLFFNTPARLKFLKSDTQEEGDVGNMMARFLLSHPEISFTYSVNGKIRYRTFGDGLESALAAVYGREVLSNCLEIHAEKHGISLYGYIGNRTFSKPNRTYQSLFVNGRYVVNQTVGAAISNAYAAYLMKRQYPFYVLFLDVPPEIVDVNVHPNKADVRFADNQIIYGSVYSVVSAVLDGNSRALEYVARPSSEESISPARSNAPAASTPTMSYEQAKSELAFDVSLAGRTPIPRPVKEDPAMLTVHSPEAEQRDFFEENRKFLLEQQSAREQRARQERVDVSSLVYKGELFRTYLFYECGDVAYLVDQHAAHERLIYDRLCNRLERREGMSQPMLAPYILELNAQEFDFFNRNLPVLNELGFSIEEFGERVFKVTAVPADLVGIDLYAFFSDVLSSMESLRAIRLNDLLRDKLAQSACKAAVKGGEPLTEKEAIALIQQTEGDMGLQCPHGRPAVVKLTKKELEKLFKRVV